MRIGVGAVLVWSRRRRDRERLAALRAHGSREAQAAATLVAAGELTLDDAEAVAEGAGLDDIVEQVRMRRATARPAPTVFAD